MSRGLNPTGLCGSSTHLVQCGSDEPSWTRNQIWVQARMPDYSLNWTTGSSAIQRWQRWKRCSSPPPTEGGPAEAGAFRPQVCHGALTVWHGYQTIRWTVSKNPLLDSTQCLQRIHKYKFFFGRLILVCLWVGINWITLLMISFLLLHTQHFLFAFLGWFAWSKVNVCTTAIL